MNPQDLEPGDPPSDPRDELVSAVLDGEATPEEESLVRHDPDLAARLARFRAIAAVVAAPVPVNPEARQRTIDAAIAAFEPSVASTADVAPARGDARHRPRLRRHRRRHAPRRTLVAATLVVVTAAAVLAGRLASQQPDPAETATAPPAELTPTTAPPSDDARELDAAADHRTTDMARGADVPPSGAVVPGAVEFGEVANADVLEARVRAVLGPDAPATTGTVPPSSSVLAERSTAGTGPPLEPHSCEALPAPAGADLGDRLLEGRALLDGRRVVVYVIPGTAGRAEMVVVDAGDCAVVVRRPL